MKTARRASRKNPLFTALLAALTLSGLAIAGEEGEFYTAVGKGDLDKVKTLLKANPELANRRYGPGWLPLQHAAGRGHKDVVEFLLANNADINAKDFQGTTALSASLRHKEVAEYLLSRGVGYTIHDAVLLGDIEKVKVLLKANPELVLSKNGLGLTPLHCAVWGRREDIHVDIVEFLLANKADVNARDSCNATPLMYAAVRGLKNVAELFLANNADVNARDYEGLSALHSAIEFKRPDVAELLRQHGGNDLWTDFRNAIVNDRLADFKGLLKDHPDLVFSRFLSKTPLHLAAEYDRKEMAELLLDNKADVNAEARDGTPLKIAVYLNNKDVADLLRRRGGHE